MNAFPVSDRAPIVISATALGMLAIMTLLLAGAPLYTEDLWWHLKAGEMYVTDGPWPSQDWMLHTAREDAPIQHEWLFGVSVYALEKLLGFHGLRVIHAAAVAVIIWMVFVIFRRAPTRPAAACFAVCMFIVLAWFRLFQFRPDLVSIIATLAGYRLLLADAVAPSRSRIVTYAVLVALWANFHSLFLVSLNLLIAAILGVALCAASARSGPRRRSRARPARCSAQSARYRSASDVLLLDTEHCNLARNR